MFKKINLKAGFSIVELMVVVIILGGLASLAMPRLRQFIAESRQAEAKNLLAQIHTLQISHQNSEDSFVAWAKGATTQVGKGGVCNVVASTGGTCSGGSGCSGHSTKAACLSASGCSWAAATSNAHDLGFKPQNCGDLRYGYWIITGIERGQEGYLAVAYAPSDTADRIYPTCTGSNDANGAARSVTMKHPFSTIADQSGVDGDWQTVNENKAWGHDDIIEVCK